MSGQAYLLLVFVCALWLGVRAATQPALHDFDEHSHLLTVAQVRQFGGMPPASLAQDLIFSRERNEVTYHHFQPTPYLVMAGLTSMARTEPSTAGVLGIGRALSALLALSAVTAAGIAVRNLQRSGSDWRAPAVVTAGMSLMPAVHSLGASVTASTWALSAVALTTVATTWAVRRNWSPWSSMAVAAAAAFTLAVRASAYPILLLIPLAMIESRLSALEIARKLVAITALSLAVNGWWIIRSILVNDDWLGASVHVHAHVEGGYLETVREAVLWREVSLDPWPIWSLLTSTDWLWLTLSRILSRGLWLHRIEWVDPVTIALWIGMVVAPTSAVLIHRLSRAKESRRSFIYLMLLGGLIMTSVSLYSAANLSAQLGWFAHIRDTFIVSLPVVVALAVLADERQDTLRDICFLSGIGFACAANAGFVLLMLP